MKYEVTIQPAAAEEIDAAFLYIAEDSSPETAVAWFNDLDGRIASLETLPRRCPLAREDEYFEEEIRQLLVDPYRVLFCVKGRYVHILHVRHVARRVLRIPDNE